MKFKQKIALLTVLATLELPLTGFAASVDAELATIAAEESSKDERLGEINPALTEKINTSPDKQTDKDISARKKKLKKTRKQKEKINSRKLKENSNQLPPQSEDVIIIDPNEPELPPRPSTPPTPPQVSSTQPSTTNQPPQTQTTTILPSQPPPPPPQSSTTNPPSTPPTPPQVSSTQPSTTNQPPQTQTTTILPSQPPPLPPQSSTTNQTPQVRNVSTYTQPQQADATLMPTPQPIETYNPPDQKVVYANFVEVAQAVHFVPLYMTRKSGYDITGIRAGQGIVEISYGRRWEPTVSLDVRTYKRGPGEEPQDISGVEGVKWRIDTTSGTPVYIAKISDTEQVAAWAVGQYTFSAHSKNLSFASFHSIISDELIELSTHYYIDL